MRTLDELDEELARAERAAEVSDDELRRCFTMFEMELADRPPDDPYSAAYREHVFAQYRYLYGQRYSPMAELTSIDVQAQLAAPFPYSTASAQTVGNQLMAIGHTIKVLDLPAGSRVLELGAGVGNTALALAQMGHTVTTMDIDPSAAQLVGERARRLGVGVDARVGEFSAVDDLDEEFDAVLFVSSFHHAADHVGLLRRLDRLVAPGGKVAFAAEPITDALPSPWGLRLDGESLFQIRRRGWLELGFQERYFRELLGTLGWSCTRAVCNDTPWGVVFVAQRRDERAE